MFWEVKCVYTKLDHEKTWIRTRFLCHSKATATANDEAQVGWIYIANANGSEAGRSIIILGSTLPFSAGSSHLGYLVPAIFSTVCHRVSYVPPLPHYGYLFLFLTEVCHRSQSFPPFPMATGFCLQTQLCLKMMSLSLAVLSQRDSKTPVLRVLLYRQVWLQGFKCSFPAKQT